MLGRIARAHRFRTGMSEACTGADGESRQVYTGESIRIAASTVPAFEPGKPLRDHVNGVGA